MLPNNLLICVWLLVVCSVVEAELITSAEPEEVSITIYRDDLALISETRRVTLPAGDSTIAFTGVNDRMIPQSALLRNFDAMTIERNFDFDLLSPAAFFNKSIGETVRLVRTNLASGKVTQTDAKIISAGNGVILQTANGEFEAYQCSGLPESVDFYSQPANLRSRPTLSIDVSAQHAGPQELTISYLASGFEWQADYVLNLKGKNKAGLLGWLTLRNDTAISIEQAATAIVAGTLNISSETSSDENYAADFSAQCWPRGSTKRGQITPYAIPGSPLNVMLRARSELIEEVIVTASKRVASREDLGDYKLYRTPLPTTVAAQQTKQVLFLDATEVEYEKYYVFDFESPEYFDDEELVAAAVEYRVDNAKDGLLAQPLPAGTFRVMTQTREGRPFYLGEDQQRDLAVGLPVKIRAASSTDVQVQSTIISERESEFGGGTKYDYQVQHRFTNAANTPAPIEVTLGKDSHFSIKVSRTSKPRIRKESVPTWRFTLAPESETTLLYRARWID